MRAFLVTVIITVVVCGRTAHAGDEGDDWLGRDKGLHFAASGAIALGGYGGTALFTEAERPRLIVGGGLALLAGVGKEVADRYTGGDPDWRDLGWDVVGTASGLATGWLLGQLWRRLTRGD